MEGYGEAINGQIALRRHGNYRVILPAGFRAYRVQGLGFRVSCSSGPGVEGLWPGADSRAKHPLQQHMLDRQSALPFSTIHDCLIACSATYALHHALCSLRLPQVPCKRRNDCLPPLHRLLSRDGTRKLVLFNI